MTHKGASSLRFLAAFLLVMASSACSDDSNAVSNTENAKRAYLGLDLSVDKAIQLGMQGFNQASSANISPQTASGNVAGTLVVDGQVDQGASANKTMNLTTTYTGYEDAPSLPNDGGLLHVVYDGAASTTTLSMKLMSIPTGTFSGSFTQTLRMSGDLRGDVTLALTFSGDLQQVGTTDQIQRKPGTTHITGTATSPYGVYQVEVTR